MTQLPVILHQKPFTIYNQDQHLYPIVVSMPHSGTWLTQKMKDQLIKDVILPNNDWYIPQVYHFLKAMKITVIENHISRYVIDPNRSLQDCLNDSYKTNLIYTHTTLDDPMYLHPLSQDEIEQRINLYYQPYHQAIKDALSEKKKYFDHVYLIDLHSFGADLGCDIILGNRRQTTMNKTLFNFVHQELEKQGLKVIDNEPFQGGYITQSHASQSVETLQIEMRYKSYIADRYFGKEEFPEIDQELMQQTSLKLQHFFNSFIQYIQ